MYLPGVPESGCDNLGNVSSFYTGAFAARLATWLTDIIAVTGVSAAVVFHDSLGAFAGATPAPISSFQLDPVIATQRRRLRK